MRNFGYFEEGHQGRLADVRLWRRLLARLRGRRLWFALALALSLLVTCATLAQPWLLRIGIDRYLLDAGLSEPARQSGLARYAFFFAAAVVGGFLATFVQVVLLERLGQQVMHEMRQELLAHLLSMELEFFRNRQAGRLVTRLTSDIQNLHEMFASVVVTLLNDALRLGGILGILFLIDTALAAWLSGVMALSLAATYLFSHLARRRFQEVRRQLARLNGLLQECLQAVPAIQLYGVVAPFEARFARENDEYLRRNLSQVRLFGFFMPLTEWLKTMVAAMLLWFGGRLVLQGRLSIGDLVAALAYMRLFFQPLREISQKYSIVQSALASAERLFELLDRPSREYARCGARRLPREWRGRLAMHGVGFGYQTGEPVLRDVSFSVADGETVALVGRTGSGKSTVIALLLGLYRPWEGDVRLAGIPLEELDLRDLRRRIGTLLQDPVILAGTLYENIALDGEASRGEVESACRRAGLDLLLDRMEAGLDTLIGPGGRRLSAGEQQLVAVARLLVRRPGLLVLDEATAAVDSLTERAVQQALDTSFPGAARLVIAHRLATVRRADRILVLHRGEVVEAGRHEELLGRNGWYARLVRAELREEPRSGDRRRDRRGKAARITAGRSGDVPGSRGSGSG